MKPPQTLWSVYDVAAWIAKPPRVVEQMARRGDIPSRRLPDGSLVFDPETLAAWADRLPSAAAADEHKAGQLAAAAKG